MPENRSPAANASTKFVLRTLENRVTCNRQSVDSQALRAARVDLWLLGTLRTLLVLSALAAVACGVTPARYAGWEPMPLGVPVAPRDQAFQRLAQSRALWQQWRRYSVDFRLSGVPRSYRGHAYSYVRARQLSAARMEFTLFVVDAPSEGKAERVTVRALVSADPNQLDSIRAKGNHLRSEWVERGREVGAHPEGIGARTVDQLYDDCAGLLNEYRELEPHLYFHPNGVLMHCGFSQQECARCREISIESFSHYSFDWEWPRSDPAKWVCGTPWGVFPPDAPLPELSSAFQCSASFQPGPARPLTPTPANGEGVDDICAIDPSACPQMLAHRDGNAFWGWLNVPCARHPRRSPTALEIGKAAPFQTWSFPFWAAGGVDCDRWIELEYRITPRFEGD